MKNAVIYDFETFGVEPTESVVLSCAILAFNLETVMHGPKDYMFEDLLDQTEFFKFDVEDQVKNYDRKIDMNTVKWWMEKTDAASKAQYVPDRLLDKKFEEFPKWFLSEMPKDPQMVLTRGNTFDPPFLKYILKAFDMPEPYPFWVVRDTRSVLDGMTWGQDIRNDFVPDGLEKSFDAHDPRHDIAMDVIRMQYISRIINDEIPF